MNPGDYALNFRRCAICSAQEDIDVYVTSRHAHPEEAHAWAVPVADVTIPASCVMGVDMNRGERPAEME
jgi:hypothetical protein